MDHVMHCRGQACPPPARNGPGTHPRRRSPGSEEEWRDLPHGGGETASHGTRGGSGRLLDRVAAGFDARRVFRAPLGRGA
eukprot:5130889-Prymnesium_polylepis.1